VIDAFKAVSWPYFCECTPGTPQPIPIPPPVLVQPPDWPATPTFSCSPDDLCAALIRLQQQVAGVQSVLAENYALTTLLQRYTLPFGIIPGAFHSDLSAQGSFATSRLIGLEIFVIDKPDDTKVLEGNPAYLWDMGWLTIIGPNGMIAEQRLTRDNLQWTPVGMAGALEFRWYLLPGVHISVRELQAEP